MLGLLRFNFLLGSIKESLCFLSRDVGAVSFQIEDYGEQKKPPIDHRIDEETYVELLCALAVLCVKENPLHQKNDKDLVYIKIYVLFSRAETFIKLGNSA